MAGEAARRRDDWPHTTRLLPWMLAAFVAMLWLVPFDAVDLPVALPFDTKLDRIALVLLACGCAIHLIYYRRTTSRTPAAFTIALLAFVALAFLSLLLNLEVTSMLGDDSRGIKGLFLLVSYATFFAIVTVAVRPSEARNFVVYMLILSALLALGTIYEYRTTTNLFYDWTRQALDGFASVEQPPGDPKWGRKTIVGPGAHALVPVTLLGMAIPFCVVMMLITPKRRLAYLLLTGIVLAGTVSTIRKASFVAPAAALLVLVAYRPRQMMRLAPLGLVLIAICQVLSPGAAVTVKAQFIDIGSRNTTQGRTDDYNAVTPDVYRHPILGRGYQTYDPDQYRILDNQYLGIIIGMGFVGLGSYLLVVLTAVGTAHPVIRRGPPVAAAVALGGAASAVAFGVTGTLFDVLSFPQVPYAFFFIAGLIVVVAAGHRRQTARAAVPDAPDPQPQPPAGVRRAPRPAEFPRDLSVVMVTHNGREMALATLRSARAAAAGLDAQWIVVDSGSTDGTPDAVAAAFPDVHVLRRPNIGFAAANNVGIPAATGRYVLLLNPDIEVVDGTFAELLEAMDERPEVGLASVIQLFPDRRVHPSIRRFPTPMRKLGEALWSHRWPVGRSLQEPVTTAAAYEREGSCDWVVGAFMLARHDALREVGLLDERFFMYSEETDWCLRFREAGWDVRHVPVMSVVHYGAQRPQAELAAQLSHSKVLYADKHFSRLKREGIRLALMLRHGLRALALLPAALVRRGARERLSAEGLALRVSSGLRPPPFQPRGGHPETSL